MGDFTQAERAYIDLFERAKQRLPDAYSSIKQLVIVDEKSLLDSLFYFMGMHYHPTASVFLAGEFLTKQMSVRVHKLKGQGYALNFSSITNDKRREAINSYFQAMMSYLPSLKLSIEPNYKYLENQKVQEQTRKFLQHLEINRTLLLTGPPHANQHTINKEKASLWVSSQKTSERQRLAQILLDNIRYISHSELLTALEVCVEKAKSQLKDGPVIFIVGSPKKSNYYISLLFAHFWLEKGLRLDAVMTNLQRVNSLSIGGNFLDIDDMSYSGSQTETVLSNSFASYVNKYHEVVKNTLENDPAYDITHMLLPRYLVEESLSEIGFQFILVRAFMSEQSFKRLTNDSFIPKFPIQVATSEVIPYMPTVDPSDRKKIEYLFNDDVYTTVYFDHKVADTPSTYLFPIAYGIIPEKSIVKTIGDKYNKQFVNNVDGEGIGFLPFLNYCSQEERPSFPSNRNNMTSNNAPNSYRCPAAWYKNIDYEKGMYSPKQDGGRTRKQKRRSKRKTRSTSK